jgi:hypothetical protein
VWCLVFFHKREREREFQTTRKRTKRTRNTGHLLKREICIENVSHCD